MKIAHEADCVTHHYACRCREHDHESLAQIVAALRAIVAEQAEDEGLWFVAETAPEAYLQAALRRLHAAIEAGE